MCVFKGSSRALALFLFGFRHWFLALFSLANQSCTKDYDFIWERKGLFFLKKSNCIWDKSKADTMDSAVWTGTPMKWRLVPAESSQDRVGKSSQLRNRWEGAPERAVHITRTFSFLLFLIVKTKQVHLNHNQEEIAFIFKLSSLSIDQTAWISISSSSLILTLLPQPPPFIHLTKQ